MSFQVDTALVQAYRANIEMGLQQKGSKLRKYVRNETQSAEFEYYDRIESVEAVEVTNRHADTPLISTPHDRRRVALRDFDFADLVDRKDKIRMLADPTSSYVTNAVWALGRKYDDLLIESASAVAYTGKTGSTTVSLPAANTIAVDYVESGAAADSNLTLGKLRRVRTLLRQGEVGDEEPLIWVCDPEQIQSLLRQQEIGSSDYNNIKALVEGEVDRFMGFHFVWSNKLTTDGNNVVDNIAFAGSGLLLASGAEIMVDVGPRRDKRNSVQVYASMNAGATRMWEERVYIVKCDSDL
jgi:hypothetical protein